MSVAEKTQTPQSLALHRASPADRDALIEMYLSFEPKGACLGLPPNDPHRWLDSLRDYPNFLVRAENRVVGHAVLCPADNSAEVAVFVHQDYRGRGIGKRLLGDLVQEARRLGLRRVWGMTELDNVPMLRLARSLGFLPGSDPREFYLELESRTPLSGPRVSAN